MVERINFGRTSDSKLSRQLRDSANHHVVRIPAPVIGRVALCRDPGRPILERLDQGGATAQIRGWAAAARFADGGEIGSARY